MTAMHTLDYLLTNYKTDDTCKKLLDDMTIYIIPRVTPDGAEKYLTTPYTLRSTPVTYLPEVGDNLRAPKIRHKRWAKKFDFIYK